MVNGSAIASLKRGDCVHVWGHRFNDILLVETIKPKAPHKIDGTLLSTGETVRLLMLKNHHGSLHLRRANGETIHPSNFSRPLQEAEVLGWMFEQQRRLDEAVNTAEAFASAFKRNRKSFQKKMDSFK